MDNGEDCVAPRAQASAACDKLMDILRFSLYPWSGRGYPGTILISKYVVPLTG